MVDVAGLGSSVVTANFEVDETVVEIVVARAVGRPSAVKNNDFAVSRSYVPQVNIVLDEGGPSCAPFLVFAGNR